MPEVTWKGKEELGSESRSPDPQTKLITKLSCPQRLKACFLIITPPKTAHTCIALSTRHTSEMLHIHSFIAFSNNSVSYVLLSFPF